MQVQMISKWFVLLTGLLSYHSGWKLICQKISRYPLCSYSWEHHLGFATFEVINSAKKKKSSNLIKMKKYTRKGYRSKQKNIVYFVEPILPSQVKAEFRLFYYEGDCRRPSTQEEIKRNFIKILNESKFNDVCQGSEKCRAENVNVTCAMIYFTYGRLKRASGKMLI